MASAGQSGTTLVVYMGVSKLEQVQAGLLEGGMNASTPVAMIENACCPSSANAAPVSPACRDAQAFELKSPAILVIGDGPRSPLRKC